MEPKVPTVIQKGSKGSQKGAEEKPKGSQREPKGAIWSQRGLKVEPKGAPNASKSRPSEKVAKNTDFCMVRLMLFTRFWEPFSVKN